ncbi:MAG: LamG domain-containing protein [Kiritimatiellales bacterium]
MKYRMILMAATAFSFSNFANLFAAAAKPADITFSVDYCRSGDSIDAQQAAGSAKGKVLFETKDTRDFDTMSHSIRGLLVGTGNASVQYDAVKNLPDSTGSIELLIKPFDWEPNDNFMHMFLQTVVSGKSPFGKIFIYKYKQSGAAVYLEYTEAGDKIFLRDASSLKWEKGSWHHIVVTYDSGKEVALFVDGRKAGSASVAADIKWPKLFTVGPSGKGMGYADGATSISDVRIFNRPLDENEVAALAKDRLPDLKIEVAKTTVPATEKNVGLRSRWFENGCPKLGLEALNGDVVLPPWTPVQYEQGNVGTWGRQYSVSGAGALGSVVSAGAEVLSAPVSFLLGKEQISFSVPEVVSKEAGRLVLVRKASAKAADVTLTYTIEYDGVIWCDLALKPKGVLDRLELNIPFTANAADMIHYVGAPVAYESQDLVKHSFSRELSRKAGTVFESGLKTTVWIGNNSHGMLWFTESDQYWWPKERENSIRAERYADGRVDLKIDMIAKALPLKNNEEISIRFGMMATPVKPLPDGWRGWTYSAQYDSMQGETRGNQLIYWPDEWRWMIHDPDPTRALNIDKVCDKVKWDHKEHRKIIPYWTRLHAILKDGDKEEPDADFMREHWATEPGRPGGGSRQMIRACTTTEWGDYLVWCAAEWAKVFGRMDGVYMDETQPIPNTRAVSGGGYDDFDGTRRPTYEQIGSRNMIKRMTYNMWKANGETPASVAHCSATHTMQSLSMYTGMLIGEQYYDGYFKSRNPEFLPPSDKPEEMVYYYSYALPMDRVRAECFHGQWGAVMVWLPCLKFDKGLMANPVTARDMLSRIMQADMAIWPLFCNREEVLKTWRFREEFGITDKAVEFIPYWADDAITADKENVVVGYYKNDKKILAIISNLNRTGEKVKINFGDLAVSSVRNAETRTQIPLNGKSVELNIPRNDYVALKINY